MAKTKYIFITGGVVSSLGKGIAAASIGALLEARGLKVSLLKLDPYINVDPGTMSPLQHGEVYVTADGNYLISGDIYLITEEGLVNKSEARRDFQRKALLEGIDINQFIIFEPKDVKHNVFVFTDVDCGYCRQFHNQIQEYLDLGIKVNYLAYPRAGIGSDSYRRIVSAWCADDPNYSLTVLKKGGEIKDNLCSTNPVENHFNLGRSIGVQGTPSIVTQEGKMIPGYLPPEELLNILSANS